ncbi:sulfotransferase [Kamptonema sp. UHCC 0994]|uniref:sulfotransferase-like domain-containing protein n=1 Tax=Kamptonema sp. UHCC 0994 TaxID=3031329 RepID=UPI0023B98631|nr:sulfotransferase [Kamptonema sp. UHCC 0994]MDF0552999.1 sulfotransferase [Kamptonema sp. UHCC 0994]
MQEKRIAMWSVPRSFGTVLLQAWSSRPDTAVFDEILSFPYLFIKGKDLGFTWADLDSSQMPYTDWQYVIERLKAPVPEENLQYIIELLKAPLPEGKSICYQKHQAYHLIEEIMGLEWILPFTNCFLIRQPKEMLLSFHKIVPHFTFEETGWIELKRLFDYVHQNSGAIPPVIDAHDLLNNPPRMLSKLCQAVGVEFTEAMLSWPPMQVELNEKLAPWYSTVASSTNFLPYQAKDEPLPLHLVNICERCDEIYQELYQFRLS